MCWCQSRLFCLWWVWSGSLFRYSNKLYTLLSMCLYHGFEYPHRCRYQLCKNRSIHWRRHIYNHRGKSRSRLCHWLGPFKIRCWLDFPGLCKACLSRICISQSPVGVFRSRRRFFYFCPLNPSSHLQWKVRKSLRLEVTMTEPWKQLTLPYRLILYPC